MKTTEKILSAIKTFFANLSSKKSTTSVVTRKFLATEVPPLSSASMTITAREKFWPTSFSIPHEVAEHFYVTDVKIDKNSQFISPGCLPALVFSDQAASEEIDFEELQKPSSTLTISVTNASSTSKTFSGTLKGTKIPRSPDKPQKIIVGLGSTLVKPDQIMNVNTLIRAHNTKLSRLIIPSSVADHFTISSTRPSSPCLPPSAPATEYTEQRPCLVDLSIYINAMSFINISVRNTGDNPQNFSGAFIGHVLPPPL
jgi:hypothetical protein